MVRVRIIKHVSIDKMLIDSGPDGGRYDFVCRSMVHGAFKGIRNHAFSRA